MLALGMFSLSAQTIRIEDMKRNFSKKELFKVSGGVSASGTYYAASKMYGHLPWTYMIQGSVNFKLFRLIDLPFNFNFTNSGFTYAYPNMPNRFGIHPSYKWASAHIGDVSMSYSPYTLGGHQFTGAGVDLTPEHWTASIMFGRLMKAVEYDSTNTQTTVIACYKRLGTAAKLRYDHKVFYVGGSVFLARDYENSLKWKPDSLGITPQQNVASNIEVGFNLFSALRIYGEYAFSFLERDMRVPNGATVAFYQAGKCGVSYQIKKTSIGFAFEHIDPNYASLGAYYFNSDFQNYTLNVVSTFLNDKMNLSVNAGIERDNVKKTKVTTGLRFVGAFNWSYMPNEKMNFSASYSNFQMHKNVRSQFDYINQYDITENLDTLEYSQLSHNAMLSAMWNVKNTESQTQSLNLNASFQCSKDQYGDSIPDGSNSMMLNTALMHSAMFKTKNVTLNSSANVTWNRVAGLETIYVGPTIGVTALFVKKTLNWTSSLSANVGLEQKVYQRFVANARTSLAYTLKKHHKFTFNAIGQYQWVLNNDDIFRFSATVAYGYIF